MNYPVPSLPYPLRGVRRTPPAPPSVELLPTLHRLGVRVASIAHWGRTPLADGSGEDATGGRLTHAEVAAVREMERLGMIFDVSHLGARGVEHVLELATRPVMATHSSARALRDHHRNLTDDQIRGVAATGGVVCVNFFPGWTGHAGCPWAPRPCCGAAGPATRC
ncbi:dipeptidase [Microbispora bryophytorum]|uniref:dipeptidase n=1 Tax=Microbispora bryophytorum TaxID=1460882 RepID=UPI0037137AB6